MGSDSRCFVRKPNEVQSARVGWKRGARHLWLGNGGMTPTNYEKAVLERFRTDWPPSRYLVRHNIRLVGTKTKVRRQTDISLFEAAATGHS